MSKNLIWLLVIGGAVLAVVGVVLRHWLIIAIGAALLFFALWVTLA